MAEDNAAPEAAGQNQPQTVEVPISSLGDVKEGDMVQFRVVSVDQQNGVANLAVNKPEASGAGGTDGMADEFSSPQSMQKNNPTA